MCPHLAPCLLPAADQLSLDRVDVHEDAVCVIVTLTTPTAACPGREGASGPTHRVCRAAPASASSVPGLMSVRWVRITISCGWRAVSSTATTARPLTLCCYQPRWARRSAPSRFSSTL